MTEAQPQPAADPNAQEAARIDLQNRVKGFNEKMIPLLREYKLGLGAQPLLTNDGRVVAKPIVFDDSKAHAPAPENTPADNAQGADAPPAAAPNVEGEAPAAPPVTPAS